MSQDRARLARDSPGTGAADSMTSMTSRLTSTPSNGSGEGGGSSERNGWNGDSGEFHVEGTDMR